MADFIIWVQISWALECAWFASWPGWLQVAGVLVAAYGLLWLVVVAMMHVNWWLRGLHKPRLTLVQVQEQREEEAAREVQVQASATIISIEAYLRRMREVPEEGA